MPPVSVAFKPLTSQVLWPWDNRVINADAPFFLPHACRHKPLTYAQPYLQINTTGKYLARQFQTLIVVYAYHLIMQKGDGT